MTETVHPKRHIEKVPTNIHGLDIVLNGGLPERRVALLVGTAGSGKTIFGCEFLWRSITEQKENAVFVSFEESQERIVRNISSFGWDFQELVDSGRLAFVELNKSTLAADVIEGEFDLRILVERIKAAVEQIQAKRVFVDSISAFFEQLRQAPVRRMLLDLSSALAELGVTSLISAERYEEYGSLSAYKSETFVSDCVLILRHILEEEKTRRTVQVLKYRGSGHSQGEYPFTISNSGVVVMPNVGMELTSKSSMQRTPSGNAELDRMCGGGFFRDSIILVSGPTGTGKTLLSSQFVHTACMQDEKAILFAFEESREQLFRNGSGWSLDLAEMEKRGFLKVVCNYPESAGPEDHLLRMKQVIEEFQPQRIAVDSLSALERVISVRSFREFVISLTSHIKQLQVAGFFTNTTATLLGGESITETHISTLTDSILLLRYVETGGRMRRGMTVIKMRGSDHEKEIVEYSITGKGLELGKPFRGVESIMTGSPRAVTEMERDVLRKMVH